jgi:hypothetical protein
MEVQLSLPIFEKYSIIKFHKTELFHAERQTGGSTDMMMLIVAFRNFEKRLNEGQYQYQDSNWQYFVSSEKHQ